MCANLVTNTTHLVVKMVMSGILVIHTTQHYTFVSENGNVRNLGDQTQHNTTLLVNKIGNPHYTF
jgi:hypothetical protein